MSEPQPGAGHDVDSVTPRTGHLPIRGWLVWPAIVVLGGAAWVGISALASNDASPPTSVSPGASSSPSATAVGPSPIASVDMEGRALPGFVTVDESLPSAEPLPPGIWDQVSSGWTLAIVAPRAADASPEFQVLYLVSPEGLRYQVLELDPAQPVGLLAWPAGESRVVVNIGAYSWPVEWFWSASPTYWLDLETGDLGAVPDDVDDVMVIDNGVVWSHFAREDDVVDDWIAIERGAETAIFDGYGPPGNTSPDGRYFTAWGGPDGLVGSGSSLINSETLEITPFDRGTDWYCGIFVWRDTDTYLGSCGQELGFDSFFEVDVSTGARTDLTDDDAASIWPMLSASCLTLDGQPWGKWLDSWGDWYEPYTVTVGGGFGEPHEITLLDEAGVPFEDVRLHGCGPQTLIVRGAHMLDGVDPDMATVTELLYWPAEDRQAVLIPRPEAAEDLDYFLVSLIVAE